MFGDIRYESKHFIVLQAPNEMFLVIKKSRNFPRYLPGLIYQEYFNLTDAIIDCGVLESEIDNYRKRKRLRKHASH